MVKKNKENNLNEVGDNEDDEVTDDSVKDDEMPELENVANVEEITYLQML